MTDLPIRESALSALLAAAFADHRVFAASGTFEDFLRFDVVRPPAILVTMEAWQPAANGVGQAGGVTVWAVRIVEAELRSAGDRRGKLLAAAEQLRSAVATQTLAAGCSPLVPAGGKLERSGDPVAVWVERFLEHIPAMGAVRPALAASAALIKQLGVAIPAATNPLPSLEGGAESPFEGDLVVIESVDNANHEFLGEILSIDGGVTVERAPARDYAAGARIHRLDGSIRLQVTPAPGCERLSRDNAITAFDLAGGRHKALLAPARDMVSIRFAPIQSTHGEEVSSFLDSIRGQGAFLYATEDGDIHSASLDGEFRAESAGHRLVHLVLPVALSDCGSMENWEAVP